jgi:hypothetical protein
MSKYKKIESHSEVLELVDQIRLAYPILSEEKINTSEVEDVNKWFMKLDLLANSNLFRTVFSNLSDCLVNLSSEKKHEFYGYMFSNDFNMQNSFHELLVGNFLQNLGYSVKFQPKYEVKGNNNPDWEIEKNEQKAIVEVFTLNKYDDYKYEQSIIFLLAKRIRKLEKKYHITLDFNRSNFEIKQIVKDGIIKSVNVIINDIDSWLSINLNRNHENRFVTNYNLIVEVLPIGAFHLNRKLLRGGAHSYRPINAILDEKEGKYHKYVNLINEEKKPFIIVCVSNCIARANIENFEDIIFGIRAASLPGNEENVINEQRKLEEVSAFMLIDYNPANLYQLVNVNIQKNPFAKYPFDLTDIINGCAKGNNCNSLFYK